jgi:hypothetical protein
MVTSLFARPESPRSLRAARPTPAVFRPQLQELENRLAPAALNLPIDVVGLDVGGTPEAPVLNAVVSLGNDIDVVPITLTTQELTPEQQQAGECAILNLELGPIDLDLLGLEVDTSAICLDITAVEGAGVLGDLLCGLSGGLDLGGIIDELGAQLDDVLGQLDDLLDDLFDQAFTVTEVFGQALGGGGEVTVQQEGICDVLFLSLGPVDLNLLGLNVALDDCEDGPVTIDVNANPEGGLLGQVLCGIAGGIDLDDVNINQLIRRVDRLVDRLTDLADRLIDLEEAGELTGRLRRQVNRLIDRLENLANRVDDLADLDRVIQRVNVVGRVLDRITDRL